jgi:ribosome-associated translation inhibitor RaiA
MAFKNRTDPSATDLERTNDLVKTKDSVGVDLNKDGDPEVVAHDIPKEVDHRVYKPGYHPAPRPRRVGPNPEVEARNAIDGIKAKTGEIVKAEEEAQEVNSRIDSTMDEIEKKKRLDKLKADSDAKFEADKLKIEKEFPPRPPRK